MVPVGVLAPDGQARFTRPASVVGRYQVIDVSLEADDGDPAHSDPQPAAGPLRLTAGRPL